MPSPRIAFVVAMDDNRLIGRDNALPWRLPDDMAWFREVTLGKPCIMGRKTYDSLPDRFRPLPGRAGSLPMQGSSPRPPVRRRSRPRRSAAV